MQEIICPHSKKAFKVDEAGYADILKQVRNSEFEQELHDRLKVAEKEKASAVELAKKEAENERQKAASAKDAEIQALQSKLEQSQTAQKHAVAEALAAIEKERYQTQLKDRDEAIDRNLRLANDKAQDVTIRSSPEVTRR